MTTYALIQHDTIWQVFAADPRLGDGFEVVAVDPAACVGWVRQGADFVAPPPTSPAPYIPDVSSAQAKIQLLRVGKLDAVRTAVAADPEVQLWFEESLAWQRNNPHVLAVGGQLGLSPTEIDNLFAAAHQILT